MSAIAYDTFLLSPSRRGHPHKSIGGSQVGAILGFSHYTTPADVWDDILERVPPRAAAPVLARGHAMEPLIANVYEQQTNRVLVTMHNSNFGGFQYDGMGATYPSSVSPWLRCSPDRGWNDSDGLGLLEIKCLGQRTFNETLLSGVDPCYYAQLQLYMGATGIHRGAFAIFNADEWKMHRFDVPFDQPFYDWMMERLTFFWLNHIETRQRPSDAPAPGPLTRMPPPAVRGATVIPVEGVRWQVAVERLMEAQEAKRLAEMQFDFARNEMKNMMEQLGQPGVRYDNTTVRWIPTSRTVLDQDALYAAGLIDPVKFLRMLESLSPVSAAIARGIVDDLRVQVDLEQFKRTTASTQFRITTGRGG